MAGERRLEAAGDSPPYRPPSPSPQRAQPHPPPSPQAHLPPSPQPQAPSPDTRSYNRIVRFRFGTFEFDDRTGLLTRGDRPIALEPQPARALGLLLSQAGELVPRDDLRARLWGDDTHVDFDRGLAYCIGQLRAALGDTAENPRFVQTLPRRGFKFIAPVEAIGKEQPAVETRAAGTTGTVSAAEAATGGAAPRRQTPWAAPAAALVLLVILGGTSWIASRNNGSVSIAPVRGSTRVASWCSHPAWFSSEPRWWSIANSVVPP